ncbi:MAG: phosphoribosylglycinamide formyltransferase [Alphaproteobacteria bacterium]|nr:phosphoribosylglycinamide formyltransferase [Alphaproteobacteria bacterium]
MTRRRLAILISGRGSNMEAILNAARDPRFPAEPVVVLSNRPDAKGLETARTSGLDAIGLDHRAHGRDREAFERIMHAHLVEHDVELVALAGFMRLLTPWFVSEWSGRLLNIHPSLLPKYPGLDTHARALEAGDTVHGCTVHLVTPGLDEGPALGSAEIDVRPGDTPDTLAARVLKGEHLLYPLCIAGLATGSTSPVRRAVHVGEDEIRLLAPDRW